MTPPYVKMEPVAQYCSSLLLQKSQDMQASTCSNTSCYQVETQIDSEHRCSVLFAGAPGATADFHSSVTDAPQGATRFRVFRRHVPGCRPISSRGDHSPCIDRCAGRLHTNRTCQHLESRTTHQHPTPAQKHSVKTGRGNTQENELTIDTSLEGVAKEN